MIKEEHGVTSSPFAFTQHGAVLISPNHPKQGMGHRIVLHEDGYVEAWVFDDEGYCDEEAAFYGTDLIDRMYQAVVYMITKLVIVK
jgi:hypothetical protein